MVWGRRAEVGDLALVAAVGAFVAAFVFAVGRWGLPIDREQVLAWTLGLVVAVSLATGHRFSAARAVRDWSVLAVLLVAYDYSRGAADWFGMPLQIDAPIIIDRALFPGDVPTVELQARLGPFHGQRWWEAAMSITYATHFVVPHAVTACLWLRDRSRWRAWLAQFTAVTSAGLAGFIFLPTMPPWLASLHGHLDEVQGVATRGWRLLNLDIAETLIDKGHATVNLVAAFPSLHAAYPALIAAFFWPQPRSFGPHRAVGVPAGDGPDARDQRRPLRDRRHRRLGRGRRRRGGMATAVVSARSLTMADLLTAGHRPVGGHCEEHRTGIQLQPATLMLAPVR